MDPLHVILIVIMLAIAVWLLSCLVSGAIWLFEWAAESGFVGVAAYFACWVFLTPVMVIGSIVVGALDLRGSRGKAV